MIALEGDTYDAITQHQMTRSTRRFAALGTMTGEQPSTNQDLGHDGLAETAASPVLRAASALTRIHEARLLREEFWRPRSTAQARAEADR